MRILLLVATLVFSYQARASDFRSRNSADLGFTTNANLTSDNQESDFFYRLTSRNTFFSGSHQYGLKLGFTDFFTEHQNDVLSLRLDNTWGNRRDFEKYLAFVGQHYPNGDAATTETAFDNVGFDISLTRDWKKDSKIQGDWGTGYRLRYYTSFAGRNDHTIFAFASADHEFSQRLSVGAFAEGGLTYSNLSDYRKIYTELTGSADLALQDKWILSSALTLAHSRFLNRDVNTQTAVTNKGRPRAMTLSEKEKYLTIYLSSEAMREQTDQLSWGGGLNFTSQSSTSNTQDYSALELIGKLLYTF